MAIYTFGSGTLWGFRTDIANATPIKFGDLQEVSLEISGSTKMLYGQNQFAVAAGRGEVKLTGKAKFARVQGRAFADLFFGQTQSAGQVTTSNAEPGTIGGTPYQLTAANGATFVTDLGVIYQLTGLPLVKVASAPITGQYCVSAAGVYTFAAADTGLAVLLSYTYSVAATGQSFIISNVQQGTQPIFQVVLEDIYNGPSGLKKSVTTLYACISSKLGLNGKTGDFKVPELDFECMQNAAGQVIGFSFSENS